jgi:hypothetical protein
VQAGAQRLTGWAEARLLDNGVAALMIAVGPKPKVARQRLRRTLRSARTMKPPKAGKSSGPWAQRLRGQTLLYLKTEGGLSTKKRLELCPGGRFAYRGHESYLSGSFSGVGTDGSSGTWAIRGQTLVLTWSSGRVDRRRLRADGGKTYVDGVRWFVKPGTKSCRCVG